MISVIIASVNPQMLVHVKQNIAETIGVPYEVLAFENSNGIKGICQIYNEGIEQANYDILCFMHEDLAMKTYGWGNVISRLFSQHEKIGIVGIAGGTYKSIMPNGWGSVGAFGAERSNLLQTFKYIEYDTLRAYANPDDECWSRVVAADGVFMCVKREVTNEYKFDSDTFKRFHCYDIDYCLSVGKKYDIIVSYEILLHHFSEGKFDHEWMEQIFLLFYKWENELPRSVTPVSAKRTRIIEKRNFVAWLKQLHAFGFGEKIAYQVLRRPKIRKILGLKYFLKFHYMIFATYHFKSKEKSKGGL